MKGSNGSPDLARPGSGAAADAQEAPLTNLRFDVAIAGTTSGRAVEVVFPVARVVVDKGRRQTTLSPLVMRRGLTRSSEWYEWWNQARRGSRVSRRLVSVAVLSDRGEEAVRWRFRDCVPVAYTLTPLNALAGAPLLESIEVQPGDFELVQRQ
jgi:phage tail-like protein